MRRGPASAVQLISTVVGVESAPRSVVEIIAQICVDQGWAEPHEDPWELAEGWAPDCLRRLNTIYTEYAVVGRSVRFAFNSSSTYMIQGVAFIEPIDSPELKEAKSRRARLGNYVDALVRLTPREFEALCAGIIELVGVQGAVLTEYSADEGIDFFGRMRLRPAIPNASVLVGWHEQLTLWMIGQAKHYASGVVSTFEIRDLVGAIELAKVHAFGSGDPSRFAALDVRLCDPVCYLFFTTGQISSNSWQLISRSGVVGMDGEMVAAFLADQNIGIVNGVFDPSVFAAWIAQSY